MTRFPKQETSQRNSDLIEGVHFVPATQDDIEQYNRQRDLLDAEPLTNSIQ